jgi:hypothetical protein
MSKEALAQVVQRSISDAAFRNQLATDPTGALRRYDLTADETAAIRHGDATRLTALGIEQRMSKAFLLASGDGGSQPTLSGTSDLLPGNIGVVQTPDAVDRNIALGAAEGGASGAVQSPDAAERNTAHSTAGAGASGAAQSPDAVDRNFIGNNQALSNVMPADASHAVSGAELTDASTDEGFLPTVGYADGVATDAGAGENTEATDVPHMPH